MPTDETIASRSRIPAIGAGGPEVPAYLRDTYTWAYLSPVGRLVFDHPVVVSAILWGNYHRLIRAALTEVSPGQRVLQTACVYGSFSVRLADAIGPNGRLDIIDVAQIQVDNCARKLDGRPAARVWRADAVSPPKGPYDRVFCFFLLHEVPDDYKARIVNAVLDRVGPRGRAVFVDYHRPVPWHPLRPVMWGVFKLLEPFALTLWDREIESFAARARDFTWTKRGHFGGLYQMTVAARR